MTKKGRCTRKFSPSHRQNFRSSKRYPKMAQLTTSYHGQVKLNPPPSPPLPGRSLLVILTCFYRFLEGTFSRKSLVKSERSHRFKPGEILQIIEHVSFSIRFCKISSLIYSESSRLSNAGPFY